MEEPVSETKSSEKPNFLSELKHRKVFRVAGTYAVVSWLIIQVASATFSSFGIPVWAFRFVVLMVILGFPVAIILAWAFELTPEGVKMTRNVKREQSGEDGAALNRKRNWLAIGMAAVIPTLIFGTLSIVFYLGKSAPNPDETNLPLISSDRPYYIGSLAVLPFTIISEQPGTGVTADGLHDEMLTVLSGMSPLDVISRTSTLRYGDFSASIPEIGKALNADFIIEGSIQGIGNELRLTLQLIEAATDNHIWAQSFDRDPENAEDLIQFNKELAFELSIRIYQALEDAYPPEGEASAMRQEQLTVLEEQLLEQWVRFWAYFMAEDWLEQSREIKRTIAEIIRLDPDNKEAYDKLTAISYANIYLGLRQQYDPDWRKEFYLILKNAHIVNPDGFDVNKHLGLYYLHYENQPNRAIPYSRKAMEVEKENRGIVDVYTYFALLESLYATGQHGAALKVVDQAYREGLTVFTGLAWFWSQAYVLNGLYENALGFLDAKIEETRDGNVAQQVSPESIIFDYQFSKASILSFWTADTSYLVNFMDKNRNNEEMPDMLRAFSAYYSGQYQEALEVMSGLQHGSGSSNEDLAELRGWIYLKSGNEALARSYFRGFLKELSESPKSRWMERFRPDWYCAEKSYAYACLGEKEEALLWAEKALDRADPMRNFEDYFNSLHRLATSLALVGESARSIELIDQILSSPSAHRTGNILLNNALEPLHGDPDFQAVIRKHADQLKDPAILNEYFPGE